MYFNDKWKRAPASLSSDAKRRLGLGDGTGRIAVGPIARNRSRGATGSKRSLRLAGSGSPG